MDGSADEANDSKKKRARRTLTVAGSRQVRRASARLTRKLAASRNNDFKAEGLGEDDEEEEDAEADDDTDGHGGALTHGHTSVDAYDVFTDGPKPVMQQPWMDWSLGNNQMAVGRHQSPMDDTVYDTRRSNALRSMSTNNPSDVVKTHSYFPTRDAGASVFASQPSIPANPYYQQQHGLSTASSYNPLCAQPRPAVYNYGYTGYPAAEFKPQQGFQAVNMTQNLGNLGYGFDQYPTDQHDHAGQDFDL
ncbi:hypothetical protein QBC40DRAFT_258601 [Triangularia verruculosa]|uniref:Uncharacterized protein n=1 Tax=Triangularia verruculosa TaxID=2587418 RepID=A0AAN7ARH5_9PEZI|nr:hypothetical protein QBC40DRAFT_258601 [Triangularia verruculosa]